MVTVEQISQFFDHPAILLIIGAGITSVLIPWFTNKWQDHRKKLEIKVELVAKISEVIADKINKASVAFERKKQEYTVAELDSVYENLSKMAREEYIIYSKLQSYYDGTDIPDRYGKFMGLLTDYLLGSLNYFYQDADAKKSLQDELERIKKYFSSDKSINLDNLTTTYDREIWNNKVYGLIRREGDEIIKDVLKRHIKAF